MCKKRHLLQTISVVIFLFTPMVTVGAWVVDRWGKTYIEDMQNELWDVSQAKTLGFKPRQFQFGIGRNAFTPLGSSDLKRPYLSVFDNPKVIGVATKNEAHAYSISRLRKHEVANTIFDGKPIAAAY